MEIFKKYNLTPNKLKLKINLNIALVGSGKMANEYAKVIKSFDHNISTIVSSDNKNKDFLIKKYNIKNNFISFENSIKNSKDVDAWIICTSWDKLNKYFKLAIKYRLIFLIEKSIITSSQDLIKINKKISKNEKKNFLISYNRNYYDYIPSLISLLKNRDIDQISVNMSDPFNKTLKKQKKTLKKNLILFITSHWISLILKILKISKNKIDIKSYTKFGKKNNLSSKTLIFKIKNKQNTIPLLINLFPNNSSNTNINFYCKKLHILLSPIEKIKINYDLERIKKFRQNFYKPIYKYSSVQNAYKPGLRFMYFDFIQACVFKKNSVYGTNIDDLIEIYKICEILDNNKR